jgi:hypothetical protein
MRRWTVLVDRSRQLQAMARTRDKRRREPSIRMDDVPFAIT